MCITILTKCLVTGLLCIICDGQATAQVVKVFAGEDSAPAVSEDTVYYRADRPLQWPDFTGKAQPESTASALSFTGFGYNAIVREDKDTVWVHLWLQTYFVRSGSWVRPGQANSHALSHEQLHFDIAKIAELAFRDTVTRVTFSPDYYPAEIKILFLDFWRRMNHMQETFDRDTGHGTNQAAEAAWKKKIFRILLSDSGPG